MSPLYSMIVLQIEWTIFVEYWGLSVGLRFRNISTYPQYWIKLYCKSLNLTGMYRSVYISNAIFENILKYRKHGRNNDNDLIFRNWIGTELWPEMMLFEKCALFYLYSKLHCHHIAYSSVPGQSKAGPSTLQTIRRWKIQYEQHPRTVCV